jgi:hypothetical protein
MGGRWAASVAPLLALAIVAVAVSSAAAEGEKCGGCTPCVGPDCPGTVVYPSPPPPALPPPPPYYYYSPPPPASYPGGSGNCPPSPGGYIGIGSKPPGKGPLYPQDPGFMPSSAPRRAVPVAAFAALAGAWAFVL